MAQPHGVALSGTGEIVIIGAGSIASSRTVLKLEPRAGGDLGITVHVRGGYLDGSWSGELGHNEASRFLAALVAHARDEHKEQGPTFGDADTVPACSETWPRRRPNDGSVQVRLPMRWGRLEARIDSNFDHLRRISAWVLRFATVLGAPRDRRLHPLCEAW